MAFFGTHVQNLKDTWDTSKGQPRPLQLVSVARKAVTNLVDEVTGWEPSFQLHEQNLKLVMSQVESDMPLAIVSVVGAFRSGKSFLLSCFLKSLETNESDGTFKEGVLGGKSGTKNGFSWKGGTEGHTQGMMVWSKPFIREVDDGKGGRTNMAVLLVDTQGTFDHKMNTHLEACLFGLSATLSSCQIFNVRNQVQADNLGSLAVYLEYGTVANDNKRGGGGQDHGAPFQRLEVLVRDWQNWKNPTDTTKVPCEELLDTFLEYLDDILEKATTDTNKVKSCFRDRVGCFGLPFPGPHVASVSFDGKISNIDEGFMRLVNYYVKDVILGKLKATNASNLSNRGGADEFIDSVKSWVQLFSDGLTNDKLPDADSWLGMVHASQNHNQMQKVLEVFKGSMDQHTKEFVDPLELQTLLEKHKDEATSSFSPRGDAGTRRDAKRALLGRLDKEARRIKLANDNRKPFPWWTTSAWTFCSSIALATVSEYFASVTILNCLLASFTLTFGASIVCAVGGVCVAARRLAPAVASSATRVADTAISLAKQVLRLLSRRQSLEKPAAPDSPASRASPASTLVVAAMSLWNDLIWPVMSLQATWVVIAAVLMVRSAPALTLGMAAMARWNDETFPSLSSKTTWFVIAAVLVYASVARASIYTI